MIRISRQQKVKQKNSKACSTAKITRKNCAQKNCFQKADHSSEAHPWPIREKVQKQFGTRKSSLTKLSS
jgi:hypothetical protein